jgi:hypothetical protein
MTDVKVYLSTVMITEAKVVAAVEYTHKTTLALYGKNMKIVTF